MMNEYEESRPLLVNDEQTEDERSEQDLYLDKVKNGKLYMATFAAVLGPLSFGFVLGYSSPAIPELCRIQDPGLQLSQEEASWFGAVVTIGAALGGLLGGWVVDKTGRKLSIMFCAIPFIFGFTVIIAAQNHWMLYVGRVLTGLASGVTSLALYISEMAHERVRGTLGSCVQLMVVTGIMGAYITGLFLDWRWLAITSSIPPTLMLVSMCFMPETPRFLLSQGKRREAEEALRFLRGPDAPVEWECAGIEETYKNEEQSFRLADLRDPGVYKPLAIGVMMMLFQQFTGINAIMFYAETIFEQAHFKSSDVATVIVAATQVIFTAVAALIMDKAGRKLLLIFSGVTMCVSEAVFGVYFKLTVMKHTNSSLTTAQDLLTNQLPGDLAWLAVGSMGVFIAGFAIGWGPTPWLVMSEIFPTRVRGLGSALCVLTNWTCAFIVTKTFQNLMDAITSAGTFWMFSGLCALNVLFTVLFVPETKGKSLEEIQARFKGTYQTLLLCTSLAGTRGLMVQSPIEPQPNFDLEKFSGEWYRLALADESPLTAILRVHLKVSKGFLQPDPTGNVNLTMWTMRPYGCGISVYSYEKTDVPGEFIYFSKRHQMTKDVTIVETNYTDYSLVLKYKNMNKEYTQVALYGRSSTPRPDLIEKFRSFSLSLGFSEEAIITPNDIDPCPTLDSR
ncbi:hypothetical protein DNTS_021379 [Danionella cerebrum]|nr:hypothetical protein DNTS_021379 [Danionella translucida]